MNARPTPGHGILSDFGVTLLRGGLIFIFASDPPEAHPRIEEFGMVAVLQGLGCFQANRSLISRICSAVSGPWCKAAQFSST
jgi:hypothetical protein